MYEPHYEKESGGGGFLIGLLCGTALGAAIALMFAPKTGSEIRQQLYDSTGNLRRKAYETYGQASEQVGHMAAKATEQVNTVAAKAREAVERGKEAYESARQSASGQKSGNGPVTDFNRPPTATPEGVRGKA
jgi:gas vesicle protein